MSNKNDLRYIKTDRLIQQTYLQLRLQHKKNIQVKTLCETALINKTTFYAHFQDINSLHNIVCDSFIFNLLENCPHITEAFSNTEAFVSSIINALAENKEIISALFGDNNTICTNLIEQYLLQMYLPECNNRTEEIKLLFSIGGALRVLADDKNYDNISFVILLLKKILLS